MKFRNCIDRELHLMVSDGMRHVLRMCRDYETLEDGAYVAIVRTSMRYYATKVKRSRRMRVAAFVGGVSLDDIVNEEFERVYGAHIRMFAEKKA